MFMQWLRLTYLCLNVYTISFKVIELSHLPQLAWEIYLTLCVSKIFVCLLNFFPPMGTTGMMVVPLDNFATILTVVTLRHVL
jgi:hypothetical protein